MGDSIWATENMQDLRMAEITFTTAFKGQDEVRWLVGLIFPFNFLGCRTPHLNFRGVRAPTTPTVTVPLEEDGATRGVVRKKTPRAQWSKAKSSWNFGTFCAAM